MISAWPRKSAKPTDCSGVELRLKSGAVCPGSSAEVGESGTGLPVRRVSRTVVIVPPDGRHLDRDLHLVAEHEDARFEQRLPGQTEVLAVDRTAGVEPDPVVAPRVALRAFDD